MGSWKTHASVAGIAALAALLSGFFTVQWWAGPLLCAGGERLLAVSANAWEPDHPDSGPDSEDVDFFCMDDAGVRRDVGVEVFVLCVSVAIAIAPLAGLGSWLLARARRRARSG